MPDGVANTRRATPLPIRQLVAVSLGLLSESICATMLIPFVGLYVAFMEDWPVEKAGYASGFLIGLFMLGQVVSCKSWNLLSERYGRKIGIVIGIGGSAVATLFFGLSPNIWICSFWRFVHGLFTGSSLISKTVIADVTDRTNEAKGFMLISLTWGVGMLFGPAIGGFLYDPAHSSFGNAIGVSSDGFMSRYPAFLASLFTAVYNTIALLGVAFLLSESNPHAKPVASAFPSVIQEKLAVFFTLIQPAIPSNSDEVIIVNAEEKEETQVIEEREQENQEASTNSVSKFGFKSAFKFHLTKDVLFISMLISASDMIYAETFPLWGIADSSVGGLGLKADLIGVLIIVNSVPAVAANMVFASMLKWWNDELGFFKLTELMYALLSFTVPFAPFFGVNGGFWFAMFFGFIRKGWESWCWSCLMMICAQTAPKGKAGTMYAVQQASSCIVRCIVPFIGAPLFAWSISGDHIFPFNHFLLFLLCVIPLLHSWYITRGIFIPAVEYEWGTEPVPSMEVNIEQMEQLPAGFSSRSFWGSQAGSDFNEESMDDNNSERLTNASFSTLAASFAFAMGGGHMQPSIVLGNIMLEDKRQNEDDQTLDEFVGSRGVGERES